MKTYGHTWHDTQQLCWAFTRLTSCLWRSSLSAVRNAPLGICRIKKIKKTHIVHIQRVRKLSRGQKVINGTKQTKSSAALSRWMRNGRFYDAVSWTRGCTLISGCTGTPAGQHKCNCRLPVLTRTFAYLHGLHLSQGQPSSCLVPVYSESNIKKGFRILIFLICSCRYVTWWADDNLCMPLSFFWNWKVAS